MSVTGGSVSVRHPAQHRSRNRLSPQAYFATTGRILRQLAADHRSVAMILVVPSLIYALEALQQVGAYPDLTAIALRDIIVVIGFAVLALCLAAATLRRRTP